MRRTKRPFLKKIREIRWREKYLQQGVIACRRGILFKLTFEEWLKVWKDSGELFNRGTKKGQYVMGRRRDKGPYALGNIDIITTTKNSSDAHLGSKRSDEHKHRISKGLKEAWATGRHPGRTNRIALLQR